MREKIERQETRAAAAAAEEDGDRQARLRAGAR